MRKINFRIWDVNNKEHEYPNGKRWSGTQAFLITMDGWVFDGDGNSYDEYHVIEPYTGIKDVNGTEIYEGDIIEYDFYASCSGVGKLRMVVGWNEKTLGWSRGDILGNKNLNIKIIGNIHQFTAKEVEGILNFQDVKISEKSS